MKKYLALTILAILVACGSDGSSTGANGGAGNGAGSDYDVASNTLRDLRDNQTYKTVKIGSQVWMSENLAFETATSICSEMEYLTLYGCLYSWDEAKTACPGGWHLPSQAEWNTLIEFVGDSATAGKILKATIKWSDKGHYKDGTDDYGFTALPGGVRLPQKGKTHQSFVNSGAFFWSATEVDDDESITLVLRYENDAATLFENYKDAGVSVRCVKN
jgi:uncharacterized protein (TIGR02145 family)